MTCYAGCTALRFPEHPPKCPRIPFYFKEITRMVNTALSPTCTNHVLKIYSTLRNQFISKLGISKNNKIFGRFPSDSKRQWAGLKRNLFLGIRVCKCSFLTNSVMPIIYLMMFIQIFEVEIEDEFTR